MPSRLLSCGVEHSTERWEGSGALAPGRAAAAAVRRCISEPSPEGFCYRVGWLLCTWNVYIRIERLIRDVPAKPLTGRLFLASERVHGSRH